MDEKQGVSNSSVIKGSIDAIDSVKINTESLENLNTDIGIEVSLPLAFSSSLEIKEDKNGRLLIDTDLFDKILADGRLNRTDQRLLNFLLKSMSLTGQNIYSNEKILTAINTSKVSLWRSVKKLSALGIIARDVFGCLYIKKIKIDGRYAPKILSWSHLLEHLANNTDTHDDNPDVCWEWKGETNEDGYGIIHIGARKTELVHRLSWKCTNGFINKKVEVHHKCGNHSCVNVRHLKLLRKDRHLKLHANERQTIECVL